MTVYWNNDPSSGGITSESYPYGQERLPWSDRFGSLFSLFGTQSSMAEPEHIIDVIHEQNDRLRRHGIVDIPAPEGDLGAVGRWRQAFDRTWLGRGVEGLLDPVHPYMNDITLHTYNQRMEELQRSNPELQVLTLPQIQQEASRRLLATRQAAQQALQGQDVSWGTQLLAGLGQGLLDPVNIATFAIPIAQGGNILRIAANGAMVGAISQGLIEAQSIPALRRAGVPEEEITPFTNMLYAAGAGAVLPVGLSLLGRGVRGIVRSVAAHVDHTPAFDPTATHATVAPDEPLLRPDLQDLAQRTDVVDHPTLRDTLTPEEYQSFITRRSAEDLHTTNLPDEHLDVIDLMTRSNDATARASVDPTPENIRVAEELQTQARQALDDLPENLQNLFREEPIGRGDLTLFGRADSDVAGIQSRLINEIDARYSFANFERDIRSNNPERIARALDYAERLKPYLDDTGRGTIDAMRRMNETIRELPPDARTPEGYQSHIDQLDATIKTLNDGTPDPRLSSIDNTVHDTSLSSSSSSNNRGLNPSQIDRGIAELNAAIDEFKGGRGEDRYAAEIRRLHGENPEGTIDMPTIDENGNFILDEHGNPQLQQQSLAEAVARIDEENKGIRQWLACIGL